MTGRERGHFGDEFEPEPDDGLGRGGDDDLELLDETWRDGQRPRGGGVRWLLLLLVIPVVALVVTQLKPDSSPTASPTPSSSQTPTTGATTPGTPPTKESDGGSAGGSRPLRGQTTRTKSLGRPILGVRAGWELFIRSKDAVARIQFAKGRVTTSSIQSLGDQEIVSFVTTSAGAYVVPGGFGDGSYVPDGHRAEKVRAIASGQPLAALLPGPDSDHLWAVESSEDGDSTLVLLDRRLHRTGTTIPIPRSALSRTFPGVLSDGYGTPVVETPGGAYTLGGRGAQRFTTGVVVAAGPKTWVVDECDARNRCTRYTIDRESGRRQAVPIKIRPDPGYGYLLGSVSPDGSTMASILLRESGPVLTLTDLRSGASHSLGQIDPGSFYGGAVMAWSPDGRFLFFPRASGAVGVFSAKTGKVSPLDLGVDLGRVEQVAVRPPA